MDRTEKDRLGVVTLPEDALYGIHTYRALNNFPLSGYKMDPEFICAFAEVKQACAEINMELGYLEKDKAEAIVKACKEIASGQHHEYVCVDPFQGGAGTSTNMNINEVIANRANVLLGGKPGDYQLVDPLNHINMHQSTNDTYPTALKIAILRKLTILEGGISGLQESLQKKELEFQPVIKLGRTEMQDAIPMTLGMEFGAWAEAVARDRWRIFKNRERLKTHSLGGTAIGTGLDAPREYIFRVTDRIKQITGLVLSRSENMIDNIQNLDTFVEVSGMLKAYASNLMKIGNDIRYLSSGAVKEISIPKLQAGSSIMPGKVNPVAPEAIVQIALRIIANDSCITLAAGMGQLELNHLMPLVGHSFMESLNLLINGTDMFNKKCIQGIKANSDICRRYVDESQTLATVLVPKLGYKKIESLILKAENNNKSIREIIVEEKICSIEDINNYLSPRSMYKLGF